MENLIGPIVFALLGVVFLGFGLAVIRKNKRMLKRGIHTIAHIVDYVSKESQINNRYTTLHYPILRFIDSSGKEVTLEHDTGLTFKSSKSSVPIAYTVEEDAYNLVIRGSSSQQILPLIFIIFGAIFLVISIVRVFFSSLLTTYNLQ